MALGSRPCFRFEQQFVDFLYQQGTGAGLANVLGNYSPSGTLGALAGIQLATQTFIDQLGLRLGRLNQNNGNAYGLALDGFVGGTLSRHGYRVLVPAPRRTLWVVLQVLMPHREVSRLAWTSTMAKVLQYGFAFGVSSTNVDGNTMDVERDQLFASDLWTLSATGL